MLAGLGQRGARSVFVRYLSRLAGHPSADAVLAAIAGESGMERDSVQRYLESTEDADVVSAAAAEMQRMGIGGVPFFIFNKRQAASGAQPPEALLKAIREAAAAPT